MAHLVPVKSEHLGTNRLTQVDLPHHVVMYDDDVEMYLLEQLGDVGLLQDNEPVLVPDTDSERTKVSAKTLFEEFVATYSDSILECMDDTPNQTLAEELPTTTITTVENFGKYSPSSASTVLFDPIASSTSSSTSSASSTTSDFESNSTESSSFSCHSSTDMSWVSAFLQYQHVLPPLHFFAAMDPTRLNALRSQLEYEYGRMCVSEFDLESYAQF